jgi:hypothetical protein
VQKADGYWLYPSPGRTAIKGVPKALPLNRLAVDALYGQQDRIAGRFVLQWKDAAFEFHVESDFKLNSRSLQDDLK